MLCGAGVLMRVHIYILASTPTRIPTPLSFIKINHIRTSPANKVDSGPHPTSQRKPSLGAGSTQSSLSGVEETYYRKASYGNILLITTAAA